MCELADGRVDVCLWFIQPHVFTDLEAKELVQLSLQVPVIPIMAKVIDFCW